MKKDKKTLYDIFIVILTLIILTSFTLIISNMNASLSKYFIVATMSIWIIWTLWATHTIRKQSKYVDLKELPANIRFHLLKNRGISLEKTLECDMNEYIGTAVENKMLEEKGFNFLKISVLCPFDDFKNKKIKKDSYVFENRFKWFQYHAEYCNPDKKILLRVYYNDDYIISNVCAETDCFDVDEIGNIQDTILECRKVLRQIT